MSLDFMILDKEMKKVVDAMVKIVSHIILVVVILHQILEMRKSHCTTKME